MKTGEIILYKTSDGSANIEVKLEDNTVWLNQYQMEDLFETDRTSINRHIKNIYKTKELEENATCAKIAQVQTEGNRKVTRNITYYNLDLIISVGYRVNSKRGTQFRIWANNILKEYLVKGYIVNEKIKSQQYNDLKQTVKLLSNVIQNKELSADEAIGLLQVITDYTYALDTLDRYDYQELAVEQTTQQESFRATYDNAKDAIQILYNKFGGSPLFGNEKDESFKSSINTIYQTFDGKELYPSVEEKAAMLLYLVTKNHSFSDGNKRIAAFLFLWFLEKNGILYKADGGKLIENNTLVALTLMIAESRTEEKDAIVKVVINLINKNN
ncbi:prophage maintenance system killer protein [Parabacteroides sp. PFB2-12]|uniref:RhuM family protein n=1 Tax=unclassified Parabacteroides TaxID=2649774 RepID=UPI00247300F7|nr:MULTISPECIES: RhuM family protein [unclassified Parabacteroides]MDH6343763.1 prophage maintenance system killer protein [Parabacteroides sp. PM6-13]MDH6391925.1 prophage maintenance system killer protein [Parabacteroides sp. PFB2-12]